MPYESESFDRIPIPAASNIGGAFAYISYAGLVIINVE
jgi:hypothetical protein